MESNNLWGIFSPFSEVSSCDVVRLGPFAKLSRAVRFIGRVVRNKAYQYAGDGDDNDDDDDDDDDDGEDDEGEDDDDDLFEMCLAKVPGRVIDIASPQPSSLS